MKKQIDHAEYQRRVKELDREALRLIILDAQEAVAAMHDGENAGYYADEVHYCCMELRRRDQQNGVRK